MEKGSFVPLVFTTSGGSGPKCTNALKRLAHLIAEKRNERYEHVMGFIRTKLRFSLLKSTLIAIRGVRGDPRSVEPNMSVISFNTIPQCSSYDC